MPTGWWAIWPQIFLTCLVSHACPRMCDCSVVSFPQSAELQKKLHHLEVQLNNEKQHMGELEHKYRWGAHVTPAHTRHPTGDRRRSHTMTFLWSMHSRVVVKWSFYGAAREVWCLAKGFCCTFFTAASVVHILPADLSVTVLRKSSKNLRKR